MYAADEGIEGGSELMFAPHQWHRLWPEIMFGYNRTKSAPSAEWYRKRNTWAIVFHLFCWWVVFYDCVSAHSERPVITVGGGDFFLPEEAASRFLFCKLSSTSNFITLLLGRRFYVWWRSSLLLISIFFFKSQHYTLYLKWREGWHLHSGLILQDSHEGTRKDPPLEISEGVQPS